MSPMLHSLPSSCAMNFRVVLKGKSLYFPCCLMTRVTATDTDFTILFDTTVPTNSFMMDDVLAVAGTSLADSCMQQLAGLLLVSGGHGVTGKRRWRESETFGGCVPQTLARPDHRVLHVPADGEVRARVTLVA
eukprot:CAMPEP_0177779424 /NCGR_PEP_ID=MMETSP0491_2-20121128/16578_1 /TAXON_ID=63592 /ORGANISM="Tetraselmis chuii, Strain PLY429" /LENGTH=132 /DNA_ID=CAMNT_0019298959 /DNA_START=201 /DNA_END=595 /DNA_ORIENTATION=+